MSTKKWGWNNNPCIGPDRKHTAKSWVVFKSELEGTWIDPIGLRVDDCAAKNHAQLIAAAPDMLRLLEFIGKHFERYAKTFGEHKILNEIVNVVAKAKGEK